MPIAVTEFSPLEQTAFLTAYARALDNRSPTAILGDEFSDRVVGQIDYDFAAFRIPASVVRQTALRAKMLDERVRRYVAANPEAVVVDLGAGLNEPLARVQPPASVDWYSIDLPRVVALRDKLLPAQRAEHVIAADLTSGDWTADIPVGRPTMVIADGLFAFLSEQQVIELLGRVIDHFGTGELAFNDYGRVGALSSLAMKLAPRGMFSVLRHVWANPGFTDPHTPERWDPRLRLVEQACLAHAAEVDSFPPAARRMTRVAGRFKSLAGKARVLRYKF
ncbi:putative O-methyltransferase Omt [Mycolicibacter terrae]|uniref:O-methyltransferase Omt n=1 Tax=Mycolicibacter terrae TaxID=1788 RepID=A0AAD1HXC5_9MYCO|nr:class I SAM-dependent methyltransferase [Mycolicibacter terrae]ORW97412.1 GlcNAc transferase [Mycolicibacter terrae]BBX22549.1 putative O-methyltransferase Omt [Mycolicibacter terrae]SNV74291.1 O-methyltransferase [Mycolicibacter terrae]